MNNNKNYNLNQCKIFDFIDFQGRYKEYIKKTGF